MKSILGKRKREDYREICQNRKERVGLLTTLTLHVPFHFVV